MSFCRCQHTAGAKRGVCGRFDVDGHRRDTRAHTHTHTHTHKHTHTHTASTKDKHIVLTLIKEEKMCRLEKTVCAMAICSGS